MAKRRKEPLEDGSSAQEIKAVAVSSDNAPLVIAGAMCA